MNVGIAVLLYVIAGSIGIGITIDLFTGRGKRAMVMGLLTLIVFGFLYCYVAYYK